MDFIQSESFRKILWAVGALALAFLIFSMGVRVGVRKAGFSAHSGENYYRAFGRPGERGAQGMFNEDLSSGHGAAGKILRVSLPKIVIADRDGTEKTIVIATGTALRKERDEITVADIHADEYAVAVGEPDENGEIEARFLRILPPPPDAAAASPISR